MTSMSNPFKMLFSQEETIDRSVTTMQFVVDEKIYNNQRLIEVFLFGTRKKMRKDLWRDTFLTEICLPTAQRVQIDFEKPIFTDKQQAYNYGRFLSNSYCMIKAYVFDLAIESKDIQLYLRNHYLQNDMVHGFYPSITDLRVYLKNPEFDVELLKTETIVLV